MNRAQRYAARREARLDLHAKRGPILPWDVAATIAILVGAALVLPVVTTVSGLAASLADQCGDQACLSTLGLGLWLGLLLPVLTFLVGAVVSVVRLVRHRRGWKTAVVTVAGVALCLPLSWGMALIATRL